MLGKAYITKKQAISCENKVSCIHKLYAITNLDQGQSATSYFGSKNCYL